MKNINRNQNP